jgi:hypothetical protein
MVVSARTRRRSMQKRVCGSAASGCNIICTQPRRLATTAVAERVAKERDESIGRFSPPNPKTINHET